MENAHDQNEGTRYNGDDVLDVPNSGSMRGEQCTLHMEKVGRIKR